MGGWAGGWAGGWQGRQGRRAQSRPPPAVSPPRRGGPAPASAGPRLADGEDERDHDKGDHREAPGGGEHEDQHHGGLRGAGGGGGGGGPGGGGWGWGGGGGGSRQGESTHPRRDQQEAGSGAGLAAACPQHRGARAPSAAHARAASRLAWVAERSMTFRFRQIWSDTVVVSALQTGSAGGRKVAGAGGAGGDGSGSCRRGARANAAAAVRRPGRRRPGT